MSQHKKVDRAARQRKRIKVWFGPADVPDERTAGFTEDVSGTGMFLQTLKVYPPRTILALEVELDTGVQRLAGKVMWAKKAPQSLMGKKRCGMGIHFTKACSALADARDARSSV